ncbi:carboxypeptidase-like regulatory domain-containing protein [Portibacter lacus]|uniref:Prevent-host-death protein n=1 Tax=Portibacter lacus TaxID=1099794 RepID=A0AA37STM2_9BACT|nr:carboxypeptidase-like regulatory domain-containing protein [Portibacter lacus]GLR17988.1 prevent-host-death protein [Portibacter lacus]
MRVATLILFLFLGQWALGQADITIIDKDTKDPLIGANVIAKSEGNSIQLITDMDGRIRVELGYPLELNITYLGYVPMQVKLAERTEDLVIQMIVDEMNIAVNPIIIANPFLSDNVSFNRKEFQVLPGAYEDPSRLILKAPGFSTSNDQANSILYKGMPSNFVNWTLNDGLIVNPNHQSNAGTLSDISSPNAGGVNMISAQVIGSYDFQSAPYSTPRNNSIAGNSNVNFSNFNNSYLNLSLVGLEAGLGFEGKKLPGFQANYRYSTVGILTGVLGLDFGGEEIIYQDLFTKFDLIDKEDTQLSGFVILGKSHNYKDALAEKDSVKTFKDIQDIYFDSEIILSGLTFSKKWNGLSLKSALNFSAKEDQWRSEIDDPYLLRGVHLKQTVTSALFDFNKRNFHFGANMHYIDDSRINSRHVLTGTDNNGVGFSNFNIMPYANYEWQTDKLYISGGSGLTFNSVTSHFNLEPHLKVIGQLGNSLEAEIGARRNTQILTASSFSYEFKPEEIKALHFEGILRLKKRKYTVFMSAFSHHMNNILMEKTSNYSQYTGLDHPLMGEYDYSGNARSQGVSLGFSSMNLWLNGLSLSANGTVFNSDYGRDGNFDLNNTFDFENSYNVIASYNRPLRKDKELVTSISYHVRGGLKEFPIAAVAGSTNFMTSYDFSSAPVVQLADYERIDFRIVYNLRKGNYRKFAKSISLDIQNLANKENDASTDIDFLTGESYVRKQLGMIPILAYRIEF